MPTAVPVKFLDIFILLSLFNLKNVFYYSFNFHFYSQLLPFKKKKTYFFRKQIPSIFFIIAINYILYFLYCIFESLTSRFLIFDIWYLLSILYFEESNLQYLFSLRDLITGLTALSPFDSPRSPPGNLYLLSPSSFLYITLWISLGVPGNGEHLGIRLLTRLLSPHLTPPFLLPITSYLPPPFSLLYITVWISLGDPGPYSLYRFVNLSRSSWLWRIVSPINLGVLSSMLYGWRSLEVTVREGLKARGRRLNSKTLEHQRTPDQGTLIDKSSPKSLHTYTETKLDQWEHTTLIL